MIILGLHCIHLHLVFLVFLLHFLLPVLLNEKVVFAGVEQYLGLVLLFFFRVAFQYLVHSLALHKIFKTAALSVIDPKIILNGSQGHVEIDYLMHLLLAAARRLMNLRASAVKSVEVVEVPGLFYLRLDPLLPIFLPGNLIIDIFRNELRFHVLIVLPTLLLVGLLGTHLILQVVSHGHLLLPSLPLLFLFLLVEQLCIMHLHFVPD